MVWIPTWQVVFAVINKSPDTAPEPSRPPVPSEGPSAHGPASHEDAEVPFVQSDLPSYLQQLGTAASTTKDVSPSLSFVSPPGQICLIFLRRSTL